MESQSWGSDLFKFETKVGESYILQMRFTDFICIALFRNYRESNAKIRQIPKYLTRVKIGKG